MEIKPFDIEQWMNEFENHCDYNLAETCVASLSVEQLLERMRGYLLNGDAFGQVTRLIDIATTRQCDMVSQ